LVEGGDEEYPSYALNFMTFENMSKQLWQNMLLFSLARQSGQIRKNHFFHKQKLKIGFLELYIREKLLIILFWLMNLKLLGVFVCEQLWILYSKTNFEVLYLTQFSIFFEKNKTFGCRLIITTLQPLGLAFFNSMTKFLTILYFK